MSKFELFRCTWMRIHQQTLYGFYDYFMSLDFEQQQRLFE